jgi:hypothetical protein
LTKTESSAWGFSLFCDDIRVEMGAKLSVMGIYQSDMIFPATQEFPFNLAKFGILFKYYETKDALTDDIAIRVFLPGDQKDAPSVVLPFPRAQLISGPAPYPLEEDQERIFNLTFPFLFTPLLVKQEGFIKVRVACGERITNLGSLMIRKARPDENIFGFIPPAAPTPAPVLAP